MKKQWLTGAALAALTVATPALAAPPTPMQTVYNWTGFYVGGNAGYSWGHASTTVQDSGLSDFNNPTGTFTSKQNVDGFIGGGQFGYNWQAGPAWVYGFETDFQGSAEKGSSFGCDTEGCQTHSTKLSWFGTTRIRLGALVTPTTLVYATGGFAYGELKTSFAYGPGFFDNFTVSNSQVKFGTAFGAGIESAIGLSNWTWKVEYLHLDFGSMSGSTFESSTGNTLNWNAKFSDDIVRGGINYRFR
ncbi:MAG: porin family protein [Bradyrhizobiaceae bacterium]|nr:MAG: porin family protein [Bradyrhizobiaceae bacterium]